MGYIDKKAFKKHLEDAYCNRCMWQNGGYSCRSNKCINCDVGQTITTIRRFPDADVQPVKRGKWIYGEHLAHCSECGCECEEAFVTEFCANCGARMESED